MSHSAASTFRWDLFNRHLATFGAVVIVIAVAVLMFNGLRPLHARASRSLIDGPVTIQYRWPLVATNKPDAPALTWIPQAWQKQLLADARARLGTHTDPFDPQMLGSLSGYLAKAGWFEEAPTVRRQGATSIVIEGHWRTPAALVRYRPAPDKPEELLWLSTQAMPMPRIADPGRARPRLITNPSSGPPVAEDGAVDFNAPWPGEDIDAALELISFIARQPWADQVAGIDLSEFTASQSLTILTTYDTRVVWGGRPSRPRYGDAPTREKLKHLATLFSDTRRIDGGHPVVYVDSPFLMFDRSATAEAQRRQEGQNSPPPPAPDVVPDPARPKPPAIKPPARSGEPRRRS